MTNKEIAERLEENARQTKIIIDDPATFYSPQQIIAGLKHMTAEYEAFTAAVEIIRKVERGEIVDVVRCGECKKAYITSDCGRKCKCINGKSGYCLDWDFCSEGERKDGDTNA